MTSNIILHPAVSRSPILIDKLQRATDMIAVLNDDFDAVLVDAEEYYTEFLNEQEQAI